MRRFRLLECPYCHARLWIVDDELPRLPVPECCWHEWVVIYAIEVPHG